MDTHTHTHTHTYRGLGTASAPGKVLSQPPRRRASSANEGKAAFEKPHASEDFDLMLGI
jgi:hypothetical protein